MPPKAQNRGEGVAKNFAKIYIFLFEFYSTIDYIFVYLESFDSLHLDLL